MVTTTKSKSKSKSKSTVTPNSPAGTKSKKIKASVPVTKTVSSSTKSKKIKASVPVTKTVSSSKRVSSPVAVIDQQPSKKRKISSTLAVNKDYNVILSRVAKGSKNKSINFSHDSSKGIVKKTTKTNVKVVTAMKSSPRKAQITKLTTKKAQGHVNSALAKKKKKALVSSKTKNDKINTQSMSKKRSRSVMSSVSLRKVDTSALHQSVRKQEEDRRAQMKSSRLARAAARGLPINSTDDEQEGESESEGESENLEEETKAGHQPIITPGELTHSGKDSAADLSDEEENGLSTPRGKFASPVSSVKVMAYDMSNSSFPIEQSSPLRSASTNMSSSFTLASPLLEQEKSDTNTIPNLSVKDHEGNDLNLADLSKHEGVVLFAYPRANTPGCTVQACSYRDNHDKFKNLGFAVYGISYDTPNPQKIWKTKQNLPYSLLCSDKGDQNVIKLLGANKGVDKIERSHWIFAKGGNLLDRVIGVKPAHSMTKSLEVAEANPQI